MSSVDEPLIVRVVLDEYSEHQSNHYSSIIGKEIYPVAFNPLDVDRKSFYNFVKLTNRYPLIKRRYIGD